MARTRHSHAIALATLSALAWAPAFAEDAAQPLQATSVPEPAQAAPPPAATVSPFANDALVDPAQLSSIRGQANLDQVIEARNTSTVSNNSVSGSSVTGSIGFDAQSFQNMNGLSVLSANTGNNVAINASLNVNVSIQQ